MITENAVISEAVPLVDGIATNRALLRRGGKDVLPNDKTGYQDSLIWQKLFNFQRDAATGIINKLETYNGCILADSVGLGKTFTALAVVKYQGASTLCSLINQRTIEHDNRHSNLLSSVYFVGLAHRIHSA